MFSLSMFAKTWQIYFLNSSVKMLIILDFYGIRFRVKFYYFNYALLKKKKVKMELIF